MEPEWKLKQGLTHDMDFCAIFKHKRFVENLTFKIQKYLQFLKLKGIFDD